MKNGLYVPQESLILFTSFFTVTLVLVECGLQAMDPECDKSPCPRIKAGLVTPYHCAEVKEYQQRNRLDN